jgi:hypothetical protein
MKTLKNFFLFAVAVLALTALLGPSTASATTLEIGGVTQNKSVSIEASLAAGTSMVLKNNEYGTLDTCTASTLTLSTFIFTPLVEGSVGFLTFNGCSHLTKVLKGGLLKVSWTSGTNGTVSTSGMELTLVSTIFGVSTVCRPNAGAAIGTLTGVNSGNATIEVKAPLHCTLLPAEVFLEGNYTVTNPWGLGVEN